MSVIPLHFRPRVLRGAAKEACTLKQDSLGALNIIVYCYNLSLEL